jgi:hypothetical protein
MKLNRPVRKTEPKTRMGSGDAPAKLVKHISKAGPSDAASPQNTTRSPKVRIGGGEMPGRIVKHSK